MAPMTAAILLVEDNDDDAELTVRAFRSANGAIPIVRARDGVEALQILFDGVAKATPMLPAVVLLDLNLPKKSGLEVLKAIRENEQTQHLPVVVLTSSVEDEDRIAAYHHHVNSYVRKPVDYTEFVSAARQMGLYWMGLNVPPPESAL